MRAADILNMEVENIGPLLSEAWAWWTSELLDMVPPVLRRDRQAGSPLYAEPDADGGYRFTRNGRPAAPPSGRSVRSVVLLLPASAVLMRSSTAPAISERDTRRLLLLDVDRITPFTADQVFTAVDISPRDALGRREATLAVTPRAEALKFLEDAQRAGLEPRGLEVAGSSTRLDFMPSIRRAAGGGSSTGWWPWAAVAVLIMANIAAAVGRDTADVAHWRQSVEREKPMVERVVRLRSRVQAEDARRQALVRARAVGDPLRVLGAVTDATPEGAWVQRFAWNTQAIRLTGYGREGVDVGAALRRSPAFSHIRNSEVDASERATAGQAFDVTADVAPPDSLARAR